MIAAGSAAINARRGSRGTGTTMALADGRRDGAARGPCVRTRALLLGSVLAFAPGALADPDGWAQVIVEETRANGAMPVLSVYDPGIDLPFAYAIQRALVELRVDGTAIAGYKAGFTAPGSGGRFGLAGPVSGVLFANGRLGEGAVLDRGELPRLMVELEIAFELRSAITRPMRSVDDLVTYVRHAAPAVELPSLDYAPMDALTGVDVVATNVASGHYLVGAPFRLRDLREVNAIEARLFRDGEPIDAGPATAALGDQLEALRWLVNTLHEQGWPLEPGHVLLTGTLGRINPGEPGDYVADFGRAKLAFRILPGEGGQPKRP